MRVFPLQLRTRQAAFSLVELSVVMAIVSIIAVLGLESMAAYMGRTAYDTTQKRLEVIREALAKHRYVYGYLPCPANHAVGPSDTTFGKEIRSGTACSSSSITADIHYGYVPVRDLQLPIAYMKDGYGSYLRYVVSEPLTVAGTGSGQFGNASSAGLITIRTGKLEQPCSTQCQELTDRAAYVLLSFGGDRRGSTTSGSTSTTCISDTGFDAMIDSANCRFGSGSLSVAVPYDVFYDSRFNNGKVEENHFDDLIVWQTKSQL